MGLCAGVGGIAVLVEPALVADADAMGVVVLGVGAYRLLGATGIDLAILGDVVVVADAAEATGRVTGLQVFDREVVVGFGSGTMNYD